MKLNWYWFNDSDPNDSRWIVELNKECISKDSPLIPKWIWEFWDRVNYAYRSQHHSK